MTLSSARNKIIEDVILVHKLGELGRLRERRDAVIKQLESVSRIVSFLAHRRHVTDWLLYHGC
jgi:hypothetical protein